MTIELFKEKLRNTPTEIDFSETITVIETYYNFTPTAFQNGTTHNASGTNNGSCKVFSFALMERLSPDETLACFGKYYYDDVLKNPNNDDHQNIRNFMKTGFGGISFDGSALSRK